MNQTPDKRNTPIVLSDLLRFYIPLGLYAVIMMSSHSVINSGVSRVANPTIALAAYALTMSIMNMFASPTFTTRQMLVALAHDKASFRTGRKLMIQIAAVSFALLSVMAFTPVGEFVFINIFNAPADLYPEIAIAARFCVALPFIYTLRAYSQGIIITRKKTQYLTYSVAVRIAFMLFLAVTLPKLDLFNGATVGILIWLLGMACEASVNSFFAFRLYRHIPENSTHEEERHHLTTGDAFTFVWPLLLMSFIWTLGRPLLNFGLTRTADPELSLATYQVAQNLVWIFMGFIENNLRQVTLIYGGSQDRVAYLRKFRTIISLSLSGLLAILAFTPLGTWMLENLIGVTPALAAASKPVMMILILAPVLIASNEFYMGLLMGLRNTKILSVAKMVNMAVASISVLVLALIMPQIGAMAAAIGMIVGLGVEATVLRSAFLRSVAKAKQAKTSS